VSGPLAGRIALVSGGASGIGRATARRLAAEGATVEIVDKDDPAQAVAEIVAAGGQATARICDVTDSDQVAATVRDIAGRHSRLDILVNNAGVLSDRRPWHTRSRAEMERFMEINFFGAYELTRAVFPQMKASRHGRIIMIGSRTVFTALAGMSGYVESKSALTSFARVLARELGEHGITVNAVAPGMIATPGTRANSDETVFDRNLEGQAIKRRVEPDDVAGLVAFLAGDDAALITGQTIVCDGGSFLH
jgi:3-oxoacyl-[acyl-carrier protein] reductase